MHDAWWVVIRMHGGGGGDPKLCGRVDDHGEPELGRALGCLQRHPLSRLHRNIRPPTALSTPFSVHRQILVKFAVVHPIRRFHHKLPADPSEYLVWFLPRLTMADRRFSAQTLCLFYPSSSGNRAEYNAHAKCPTSSQTPHFPLTSIPSQASSLSGPIARRMS